MAWWNLKPTPSPEGSPPPSPGPSPSPAAQASSSSSPHPSPEPPSPSASPPPRKRQRVSPPAPPSTTVKGAGVPAHPQYASEAARLSSFENWPRCERPRPEDLAGAGFFYTGQGDRVLCYFCDGGLMDWEDDDVPWEQHARWFTECSYVKGHK